MFWAKYQNATRMRLHYTKDEQELKAKLLLALGYEEDEEKPVPCVAEKNGQPLFRVDVGRWRGLDTKYLKERYPEVYAECEKTKATRTLREVKDEDSE